MTFDLIWNKYPKKLGRKAALRHYKASVKTERDFKRIGLALSNYLKSREVREGYVQHGSTWFNNWEDYVTYEELKTGRDNDADIRRLIIRDR